MTLHPDTFSNFWTRCQISVKGILHPLQMYMIESWKLINSYITLEKNAYDQWKLYKHVISYINNFIVFIHNMPAISQKKFTESMTILKLILHIKIHIKTLSKSSINKIVSTNHKLSIAWKCIFWTARLKIRPQNTLELVIQILSNLAVIEFAIYSQFIATRNVSEHKYFTLDTNCTHIWHPLGCNSLTI